MVTILPDEIPSDLPTTTKVTPVMIYSRQGVVLGKVIARPTIRVSTWLQTEMAPLYLKLIDVQILFIAGGEKPRSMKFDSALAHTDQILAYHLLPPADEAPYYDPGEPNRKMEPVSAIVGNFRFDGKIRMSQQTNLESYLSVSKMNFLALLDVTMSCPVFPSMKDVQATFVLIRQTDAIFV